VKLTKVAGVSLGTVLRFSWHKCKARTIIRREFIEVTTGSGRPAEKTIRVYRSQIGNSDPNSINQQAVNQASTQHPRLPVDLAGPASAASLDRRDWRYRRLAGSAELAASRNWRYRRNWPWEVGSRHRRGWLCGVGASPETSACCCLGAVAPSISVSAAAVSRFRRLRRPARTVRQPRGQFGIQGGDQSQILIGSSARSWANRRIGRSLESSIGTGGPHPVNQD